MHQETKQVFVCDTCGESFTSSFECVRHEANRHPKVGVYGRLEYNWAKGTIDFDQYETVTKFHPGVDIVNHYLIAIGTGEDDESRRADCIKRFKEYCLNEQRIYTEALEAVKELENEKGKNDA